MWVLKFKFNAEEISFGKISKELDVKFTGYPISSCQTKFNLLVNLVGTISGEEKNIKKALLLLKKSKYVSKIEIDNNFLMILLKEEISYSPFYKPSFIYLEPVLIEKGIYYYNVASWNRKDIEDLLHFVEKNWKYEIFSLKKEKISNISVTNIKPNLTDKQKNAYDLAVKQGYYEYPKKTEIRKLAKITGLSSSTFQQHLRNAEKKLSSFYVEIGNRYRTV